MMTEQGLYDIYGFAYIPFWQTFEFKVCAAVILSIIVIAFMLLGIKRFQIKKNELSYWDQAILDIKTLQREYHLKTKDVKWLYSVLTRIMKRYISLHYGVNVKGNTDIEVLSILSKQFLVSDEAADIITLFKESTSYKFSKNLYDNTNIEHAIVCSLQFIKQTIPKDKL